MLQAAPWLLRRSCVLPDSVISLHKEEELLKAGNCFKATVISKSTLNKNVFFFFGSSSHRMLSCCGLFFTTRLFFSLHSLSVLFDASLKILTRLKMGGTVQQVAFKEGRERGRSFLLFLCLHVQKHECDRRQYTQTVALVLFPCQS